MNYNNAINEKPYIPIRRDPHVGRDVRANPAVSPLISDAGHGLSRMSQLGRQSTGGGAKSSSGSSPKNHKDKVSENASERSLHCYTQKTVMPRAKCENTFIWQHGKYHRDECGSGIMPATFTFGQNRANWCSTPLSMYQATIGDLGRKILCKEVKIVRDIKPEPPCSVETFILPACRGYYRKYDCIKPCEESHTTITKGKKVYRNAVSRYWQPCNEYTDEEDKLNVSEFAQHNAYLGKRLRRHQGFEEIPCW